MLVSPPRGSSCFDLNVDLCRGLSWFLFIFLNSFLYCGVGLQILNSFLFSWVFAINAIHFIIFLILFPRNMTDSGKPRKRLKKGKGSDTTTTLGDTVESLDFSSGSTSSDRPRDVLKRKQVPKRKAAAKKCPSPHGEPKYNVVDPPRFDIDDAKSREAGFEYLKVHGYARWKGVASEKELQTTKAKFLEFCGK